MFNDFVTFIVIAVIAWIILAAGLPWFVDIIAVGVIALLYEAFLDLASMWAN